uniref:Protein kinase domain-containing protein n=1 Tax=Gongylonema pulchrum TaxID=637853 RepID=A0A183EXT1_9BILA
LDFQVAKRANIPDHPNIVKVFGCRREFGRWQVITELIDGTDLFDYVQQETKENEVLEVNKVRSLFRDLMQAVQHLHSLKVAHMDIKAENCLVTVNGEISL